MLLPTPRTGSPRTRTSPTLGGSSPEMSDRVVDLPHPVGPTTAQNSPAPTVMSRSRSAVNDLPAGETNRFVTPSSSIAGAWLRLTTALNSPAIPVRRKAIRSLRAFWSLWSWGHHRNGRWRPGSARGAVRDREVAVVTLAGQVDPLDGFHLREARAAAQPARELRDGTLLALDDELDGAVVAVPHTTGEAACRRLAH